MNITDMLGNEIKSGDTVTWVSRRYGRVKAKIYEIRIRNHYNGQEYIRASAQVEAQGGSRYGYCVAVNPARIASLSAIDRLKAPVVSTPAV